MKTPLTLATATLAVSLFATSPSFGADGTWTALSGGNASGNWSTPGNWSGGTEASGSGFTADFSTLDITVDSTITLDASRTIGSLVFGDTSTGSSASWILAGANPLTLAGGTPGITVNALGTGASASVNTVIDGSAGLTKSGTGLLNLGGTNIYTGTTTVSGGTLRLTNAAGVGTTSSGVTVSSGAVFDVNGFNLYSTNKTFTISGNGTGAGALVNNSGSTANVRRIDFTSAATVGGSGRLDVGFGATAISGGTNTLTKTGAGQFTINSGTVNVGTVDVQQGSLVVVNNSGGLGDTTFGTTVASGAVLSLYQNGASAMTVAENITLANNAELRASRSQLAMTLSGNLSLTSGAASVNVSTTGGDANSFEITGDISGAGLLNKIGTGTLILSGTNSYGGGTTVSAGTLQVAAANLPGNVTNNAALVFNQIIDATYSGEISGTGALSKTGAGVLTLSGANSFSGETTVSNGTLKLGNNSALGTTAGSTTVASGAAIDLNGQNIGGEVVQISGTGIGGTGALINTGGTASNLRLTLLADATIGGTGQINTAFGSTVINAGTHQLTKIGSNQFTINVGTTSMGSFFINEGSVVVVNSATPFGDTTADTSVAAGATLSFFNNTGSEIANSENFTFANTAELASSVATGQNTLNGNILLSGGTTNIRVESDGASTPGLGLAGVISGTGGINKTSAGTLLLSGVNTFTGDSTVTGGALELADNAEWRFAIASSGSNNDISGTGILELNGDFRFDLTNAGTTVGNSWNIVDVGSLTETFETTFTVLSTNGSFANSGGIWTINENGVDYQFSQATGVLSVVPEPSTGILLTVAGTSLLLIRRRRTA